MSTRTQEAIKGVIDNAQPYELFNLAAMVRDAYKVQVRDHGMKLDPKLMRAMNDNVAFYRKHAS